jgi:hypothetical protein
MLGIIRQNAKTVIISGTVAACTAAVMAGAPALASSLRAAAPSPLIIAGSKHIDFLPGTPTVATMSLPAGSWAIFAKADLSVGADVQMHCKLIAGNSSDQTDPQMRFATFDQGIALNVTHRFGRPGSVKLTCDSSGVSVAVINIKITAVKAGKLTIASLH